MNELKDSKALSQKRFNRFAPLYVTSATHAQGPDLERLVEIVYPQPDWVVLDDTTPATSGRFLNQNEFVCSRMAGWWWNTLGRL